MELTLIRFTRYLVAFLHFGVMPAHAQKEKLADVIEHSIKTELLNKWYPAVIDEQYGGYLTTFTYDFQPTGPQDKMIVTQARHVWTSARAAMAYPEISDFKRSAAHGFRFLKDVMWDKRYGGFHTLVDRKGNVKVNADQEKTAYGNAFAIYALAAYYQATGDTAALQLAKKTFHWLEEHSHDPVHLGYFQHMQRNGTPIKRSATHHSTSEVGYKDQNSSIHLLEAFTELYQVWPDELLGKRLKEMLILIRDTIVTKKGYMVLFFQPDWTPVSFRNESEETIMKHHNLDHVSFGHDVEIAYLMLEALHVLGIKDDKETLAVAKRLVDHSLANGWDHKTGGFYDGAYYFKDRSAITVTKETKNWWAQAEGLNTLLMMADYFPDEPRYRESFYKLWDYINTNLIDHEYGEWFQGGIDREPAQKKALKGHIWKASYHQYRALANCVQRLRDTPHKTDR